MKTHITIKDGRTTFELVDRTLAQLLYKRGSEVHIECYLHEDTLAPERFELMERTGYGELNVFYYNDETEAREAYRAAATRTKERITMDILNNS